MLISEHKIRMMIRQFLNESYKGIFDGGWNDDNWNKFIDSLDDASLPVGAKKKDLKASWPKAAKKLKVTANPAGVKKFVDQVESGKYKYAGTSKSSAKPEDAKETYKDDSSDGQAPPAWTSGKYTSKGSTSSNIKLAAASIASKTAFQVFKTTFGSSRNLITKMFGDFVQQRKSTFTEKELDPDIKLGLGFIVAWTISKNKKAFESGKKLPFGDDKDYQAVAALPDYIDVFGPSYVAAGGAEANISDNMLAAAGEKDKKGKKKKGVNESRRLIKEVDETIKRSFTIANTKDPLSNIKNTITHMYIRKNGEDGVIIEDRYDFNPARNMITSDEKTSGGKVPVFTDISGKKVKSYQEDKEYFSNPDYLFHFLKDALDGKTKIWHGKKGWVSAGLFSRAGIENLSRFYQGCYGYGGYPIIFKLKITELLKYDGGGYFSNTWQRATSGLSVTPASIVTGTGREISASRKERKDQLAGRELSISGKSERLKKLKKAIADWESNDERGKKINPLYIKRMKKSPNPIAVWERFKKKNLDDFPRRNTFGIVKYQNPEDRIPDIFKK